MNRLRKPFLSSTISGIQIFGEIQKSIFVTRSAPFLERRFYGIPQSTKILRGFRRTNNHRVIQSAPLLERRFYGIPSIYQNLTEGSSERIIIESSFLDNRYKIDPQSDQYPATNSQPILAASPIYLRVL